MSWMMFSVALIWVIDGVFEVYARDGVPYAQAGAVLGWALAARLAKEVTKP